MFLSLLRLPAKEHERLHEDFYPKVLQKENGTENKEMLRIMGGIGLTSYRRRVFHLTAGVSPGTPRAMSSTSWHARCAKANKRRRTQGDDVYLISHSVPNQ